MHVGLIRALLATALFFLLACTTAEQQKFNQYYRQGQLLYEKHCSNCHQTTGKGLGRVYPPLAQSDFMEKNFEKTLCLMRHGISGEVVVNNQSFNQPMPGVPSLTDLEIAEIATYIYNTWGNQRGLIDVKSAEKALRNCERN